MSDKSRLEGECLIIIKKELDAVIDELIEGLTPAGDALRMNGPAFSFLAIQVQSLGKPVLEITLGELGEALERATLRYDELMDLVDAGSNKGVQ